MDEIVEESVLLIERFKSSSNLNLLLSETMGMAMVTSFRMCDKATQESLQEKKVFKPTLGRSEHLEKVSN